MKRILLSLLSLVCLPVYSQAVPAIQEAQLDNGLRILLMEAHNVPMVSAKLVLPAGSRFDAAGKEGSASLLAGLLNDHTARHNDKQWAELLDAQAIRLGSGADRDTLSLSLTVLRESWPDGAAAMAEALLEPGWNRERFNLMRDDTIASLHKSQEEPGAQAAEAGSRLLFGTHPYGHSPSGTETSVSHIALTDLKTLYQQQCKPQGSVLAVSGDINMQELLADLKPLLRGWQGKPAVAADAIATPEEVHGQHAHVVMPTSQMLVQLLRLGPSRDDPQFFADFVLNHLLGGGGFGSVLMEEVREKRGLVYGVYSYFMPLQTRGPYQIMLQTRADQAAQATALVQQVLQDMYEGQITQKQLTATQANLAGSFAQRMDSNRERAGLMAMIGYYKLPLNYLQVWTEKVNAVTLEEVRQSAKRWLNPDEWNVLQVGPALNAENSPAHD